MKSLKSQFATILVALVTGFSGGTNAVSAPMTNWYLDMDGSENQRDAVQVRDSLDLEGDTYIHNTFDTNNPNDFTFQAVGGLFAFTADGGPSAGGVLLGPLGTDTYLTASFTGTGKGTIGGNLTFTSGHLNVYSFVYDPNDPEIHTVLHYIGTFELLAGSTSFFGNTVFQDGVFQMMFQSTRLREGYLFDASMNDLANSDQAVSFTMNSNAVAINSDDYNPLMGETLIEIYNLAFASNMPYTLEPDGVNDLFFLHNGQYRLGLGSDVPEPGSLALLCIGLVGMLGLRRFGGK